MDFKFILDEIEKVDPEVYDKLSPRRHILKSFSSKVAVAAIPFAIGSLFKKAYGKTTATVIDALNFALQLEYLEYNFYHSGNISDTLIIPDIDKPALLTIEAHELAHINFLRNAVIAGGEAPYTPRHYTGDPYVPMAYDFTAAAVYPAFTDYATFLTLAQTFEDTGVRAYKAQAVVLQSDRNTLQNALQIHSVEARHAAHIRLMRRNAGVVDNPKPWITGKIPPDVSVQSNYDGEDNVIQANIDVSKLIVKKGPTVPEDILVWFNCATECFDEPLDQTTAMSVVAPFYLP